jgi:hypothetical protein
LKADVLSVVIEPMNLVRRFYFHRKEVDGLDVFKTIKELIETLLGLIDLIVKIKKLVGRKRKTTPPGRLSRTKKRRR